MNERTGTELEIHAARESLKVKEETSLHTPLFSPSLFVLTRSLRRRRDYETVQGCRTCDSHLVNLKTDHK